MASSRDELLARIVDEVAHNGLGDRSLRDLADAVGTSHRMLLYHFGSRHGLVTAIVEAVEASQRDALTDLAAAAQPGSAADTMRRTWDSLISPEVRPFVQLFYEAVAYASRHGGASFTGPWLATAAEATRRLGLEDDPVGTRLGVAVMRGLLIDVITGDEPEQATAALELFIELVENRTGA
ncbi:MAG: hypothetical protein R2761_29735 [Acidimicrobiales bacterium]